jgi:hypothetical protein
MKYIKLFENNKFKKGDYVKVIGDKNLYKVYSVSSPTILFNSLIGKEQYILIDKDEQYQGHFIGVPDKTEWTMWFDKEDLIAPTELEIDAIKYNL